MATRNLLVVSGLDPSGGAGLIADVRVAEMHGARPVGVTTSLTVQDTSSVRSAEPVPAELLGEQLVALLSDVELAGVKIGAVPSAEHARVIAEALQLTGAPVVWDPVLSATRGAALYAGDPNEALAALAPHLALVTPNLSEASALLGEPVADATAMRAAARSLARRANCAVLIKGGHLEGDPVDVLFADGVVHELGGERVGGRSPHGTGCALSTAIACELAADRDLRAAVERARAFVAARIAAPARPGRGRPSTL